MDQYYIEYTIGLLELQKTKLKSINLGRSKNEMINIELSLINHSIQFLNKYKEEMEEMGF